MSYQTCSTTPESVLYNPQFAIDILLRTTPIALPPFTAKTLSHPDQPLRARTIGIVIGRGLSDDVLRRRNYLRRDIFGIQRIRHRTGQSTS